MPIYAFLFRNCNRVFSFIYPTADDEREPRCPRCGNGDLERQVSLIAFARGGTDPLAAIPANEDEDERIPREGPVRDDGLYRLD